MDIEDETILPMIPSQYQAPIEQYETVVGGGDTSLPAKGAFGVVIAALRKDDRTPVVSVDEEPRSTSPLHLCIPVASGP